MLQLRDGTRKIDKRLITHMDLHKHIKSWLMHSLGTFGARTSHEQPWTHKIHHNPDLGEVTTFPFIILFVTFHGGHIQMAFCPRIPK